jgi:Rieske Fe-S protein
MEDTVETQSPTIWPLGFAIGIAVALVGVVVGFVVAGVGVAIAVIFGSLWVRSLHMVSPELEDGDEDDDEPLAAELEMGRDAFLRRATIALGGLVGAMIAVPVAGFAILPSFRRVRHAPIDIGATKDFPEGQYMVTSFLLDPAAGDVSRRTAYVRNNGLLGSVPSFTVISSRCTHVGCPTQPNGPIFVEQKKTVGTAAVPVSLIPADPAGGFGCPCHGSKFDPEGNRTAGPAARALDRYEFSIDNGRLRLGDTFSVSRVDGTGAEARIHRYALRGPGQSVTGLESWLYPVQPPR